MYGLVLNYLFIIVINVHCSVSVCRIDTMAERKRSHVWSYLSPTNSQDTVCDVCGKTVWSCGKTTNLVEHLRLNHNILNASLSPNY